MLRPPPTSPLFPYTTLFRSDHRYRDHVERRRARRRTRARPRRADRRRDADREDRKSTRLNSSHVKISYAVFCLKKKKGKEHHDPLQQQPFDLFARMMTPYFF